MAVLAAVAGSTNTWVESPVARALASTLSSTRWPRSWPCTGSQERPRAGEARGNSPSRYLAQAASG